MGTNPQLDPKVGEALCDDQSVVELMQSPRMAEALAQLKKDPHSYESLVQGDPELAQMFGKLRGMMETKEEAMIRQNPPPKPPSLPASAYAPVSQPSPLPSASAADADDVPALQSPEELAAEAAKAEGTAAFEAGNFDLAAAKYERVCALQPQVPPHWTNLAVARLRGGKAEGAVEAAKEATRLNPRFAKGWLRLGESLHATGDVSAAVDAFDSGLQRAEGAIRLGLTKGRQKAAAEWKEAKAKAKEAAAATGAEGAASSGTAFQYPPKSLGGDAAGAEATKREDGGSAGSGGASGVQPAAAKKALPALPTMEDEKRLAVETAALRAKTEDSMKRYAEMAKQQTLAAAAAKAKKAEAAAAEAAAAAVAAAARPSVVAPATKDDDDDDQPRVVDVTEEVAAAAEAPPAVAAPPAPKPPSAQAAPKLPAAAAIAPARRVMIEEMGSDDDEEEEEEDEEEEVVPIRVKKSDAATAPASQPAAEPAAQKAVPRASGDGMFAAALEEWSEGNKRQSAPPSPAKNPPKPANTAPKSAATKPAAPKPVAPAAAQKKPALPGGGAMLSNDLIFDLA